MESKITYFCASIFGDVAQLVEQRTENPCVGGSIPSITTSQTLPCRGVFAFVVYQCEFVVI